jgi:hypothetical protein
MSKRTYEDFIANITPDYVELSPTSDYQPPQYLYYPPPPPRYHQELEPGQYPPPGHYQQPPHYHQEPEQGHYHQPRFHQEPPRYYQELEPGQYQLPPPPRYCQELEPGQIRNTIDDKSRDDVILYMPNIIALEDTCLFNLRFNMTKLTAIYQREFRKQDIVIPISEEVYRTLCALREFCRRNNYLGLKTFKSYIDFKNDKFVALVDNITAHGIIKK